MPIRDRISANDNRNQKLNSPPCEGKRGRLVNIK